MVFQAYDVIWYDLDNSPHVLTVLCLEKWQIDENQTMQVDLSEHSLPCVHQFIVVVLFFLDTHHQYYWRKQLRLWILPQRILCCSWLQWYCEWTVRYLEHLSYLLSQMYGRSWREIFFVNSVFTCMINTANLVAIHFSLLTSSRLLQTMGHPVEIQSVL